MCISFSGFLLSAFDKILSKITVFVSSIKKGREIKCLIRTATLVNDMDFLWPPTKCWLKLVQFLCIQSHLLFRMKVLVPLWFACKYGVLNCTCSVSLALVNHYLLYLQRKYLCCSNSLE